MTKRQVRKRKPDSTDDIEKAVHRLREYHRLGRQLLGTHPAAEHDTETARREAARHGFNDNYMKIFQIRAFADEKKGYTEEELDELVKLCWEHHYALGFSFIPKFMAVPKAKRAKFQQEAIKGGWSSAMVDRNRFAKRPRRAKVGKKPEVPSELNIFLTDLQTRTMYWGNLKKEIQEPRDPRKPQLRWLDLPNDVREPLQKAVRAMKRLELALGAYLPKTEKSSQSDRE